MVCGGAPISKGEPERCMFRRNADEVRNLAMHMAEFNTNGIFCVGMPPINAMVPMVYEVLLDEIEIFEIKLIFF